MKNIFLNLTHTHLFTPAISIICEIADWLSHQNMQIIWVQVAVVPTEVLKFHIENVSLNLTHSSSHRLMYTSLPPLALQQGKHRLKETSDTTIITIGFVYKNNSPSVVYVQCSFVMCTHYWCTLVYPLCPGEKELVVYERRLGR